MVKSLVNLNMTMSCVTIVFWEFREDAGVDVALLTFIKQVFILYICFNLMHFMVV